MPEVGYPGEPGFKKFDYTRKGREDAEKYAKTTGLPITNTVPYPSSRYDGMPKTGRKRGSTAGSVKGSSTRRY